MESREQAVIRNGRVRESENVSVEKEGQARGGPGCLEGRRGGRGDVDKQRCQAMDGQCGRRGRRKRRWYGGAVHMLQIDTLIQESQGPEKGKNNPKTPFCDLCSGHLRYHACAP